jgi:hypothetical protein
VCEEKNQTMDFIPVEVARLISNPLSSSLWVILLCIFGVYVFFRGFCVSLYDSCGWVLKVTGAPPKEDRED